MRVIVVREGDRRQRTGAICPTPEMLAAMGRYNEMLAEAGILRAADGLKAVFGGQARCVRWVRAAC